MYRYRDWVCCYLGIIRATSQMILLRSAAFLRVWVWVKKSLTPIELHTQTHTPTHPTLFERTGDHFEEAVLENWELWAVTGLAATRIKLLTRIRLWKAVSPPHCSLEYASIQILRHTVDRRRITIFQFRCSPLKTNHLRMNRTLFILNTS